MNVFEVGFTKPFFVAGIPVRFHWTVPLMCVMFSGLRFAPGVWLGVLLVILIHELGHAFVVKRVGLVNLGIDLTGIGGVCRWTGRPTKVERAMVAWGGVLAQFVLFAITYGLVLALGPVDNWFLGELVDAFIRANLFILAFNLLPIGPLDGTEAWPLFRHLREARQRRKASAPAKKTKKRGGPNLHVIDGGASDDDKPKWLH